AVERGRVGGIDVDLLGRERAAGHRQREQQGHQQVPDRVHSGSPWTVVWFPFPGGVPPAGNPSLAPGPGPDISPQPSSGPPVTPRTAVGKSLRAGARWPSHGWGQTSNG